jgi:hypothetical protein
MNAYTVTINWVMTTGNARILSDEGRRTIVRTAPSARVLAKEIIADLKSQPYNAGARCVDSCAVIYRSGTVIDLVNTLYVEEARDNVAFHEMNIRINNNGAC